MILILLHLCIEYIMMLPAHLGVMDELGLWLRYWLF